MKHIINVVLLIIVGSVVMLVAVNAIEWLPIAAAEEAGPIDRLFGLRDEHYRLPVCICNGLYPLQCLCFPSQTG